MALTKRSFGTLKNSQEVFLYTITNSSGASVELMTLGGGIHAINVPDKNGVLGDVVLGMDNVNDYTDGDNGYQGLSVGRVANRISNASFVIDGVKYSLPKNQGSWTLHGGGRFSFSVWEVSDCGGDFVEFRFFSPDMQDGFPGNFTLTVKYTFTDDNILRLDYKALCDKKAFVNPTNHTYFNLSAKSGETIENHLLKINADYFTETDENQLPTGELSSLRGTPLDFEELHKIGDRIDEKFRALIDGIGYDNNYCLRNKQGEFSQCAVLCHEESGRKMEVYTDLPAVQLYCGGWLAKSNTAGKGGSLVTYRRGVALETQFYPDSPNHSNFPSCLVDANEEFKTTTEFRFSIM